MKIELFATKTMKQCVNDIASRIEEKETKARPAIGGFVEKNGTFQISTTARILFLNRVTRLKGTMEKEKDTIIIRGYVSDGVPTQKVGIIMGALAFVALTMFLKGNAIFAILIGMVAVGAYIPLVGDYNNSAYLLRELKRITGAKDKPPVAGAVSAKSTLKAQSARVASAKTSTNKAVSIKKPATAGAKSTSTVKKPATSGAKSTSTVKSTAKASAKPSGKPTAKTTTTRTTSTGKSTSKPTVVRQK